VGRNGKLAFRVPSSRAASPITGSLAEEKGVGSEHEGWPGAGGRQSDSWS
jgi:hypothetical protein